MKITMTHNEAKSLGKKIIVGAGTVIGIAYAAIKSGKLSIVDEDNNLTVNVNIDDQSDPDLISGEQAPDNSIESDDI